MRDRRRRGRAASAIIRAAVALVCAAVPAGAGGDPVRPAPASVPVIRLPDVVVSASRCPMSARDLCRSVTIIGPSDLKRAPGRSLAEHLASIPGVDVAARGPWGVQADIAIRGASYEQTAVMIDGVPVADPQTGHHNLDLPLCLSSVRQVEILRGSGSHLYGSGAMGGAVNLVTDSPERPFLELSTEGGQHGLFRSEATVATGVGPGDGWLSAARIHSDGHRFNTDYDGWTASCGLGMPLGTSAAALQLGYGAKDFGANGFYADQFANARERTATAWAAARWRNEGPAYAVRPAVYWRRHDDEYLLDYQRPDWYRNRHATFITGAELRCSYRIGAQTVSLFGEQCAERIAGNRLGNHRRLRTAAACEGQLRAGALTMVVSGSGYRYSQWGWQLWPGLDLGYRFSPWLRAYGSIGRAFRAPTYTELYYDSPGTVGDPALRPERSLAGECGLSIDPGWLSIQGSLFSRQGRDLIDWARRRPSDPWRAVNIDRIATVGVEVSAMLRPGTWFPASPLTTVRTGFSAMRSAKEPTGLQSKYALNYCSRQVVVAVGHRWFGPLRQEWSCTYQRYRQSGRSVLLDADLAWEAALVRFHVRASNLLNRSSSGAGFIPLPGRWISAGVSVRIP